MENLKNVSDLYEYLAEKYNKTPDAIKKIVDYQFEYVADHVRNRKGESVLLHNLGTFRLSKGAIYGAIEKVEKKIRSNRISKDGGADELRLLHKLKEQAKKP